jgi:CBS domain-containing protein
MKIKDRPEYNVKSRPATLAKSNTAREAITLMTENGYGSIVITNKNNEVEGILTERDLMTRLLHKKKDPETTEISLIMTKNVRVASGEDFVLDWLRIMSNERFRHLPIVDKSGQLVNMMSQGDFVSYTWPELLESLKGKTKESLSSGYQIALIVATLLAYALIINIVS